MTRKIEVEPHVDSIRMPENLKIGLMVSEQRKTCSALGCNDPFYGFAFGQSPFHVPEPLSRAMCENAHHGHYSDAEGIYELRSAIAGFNKRHFGMDIEVERIIVGPGTKPLIHIIFDVIRGGVVIPSPSWIGYYPQVKLLDKHFHTIYTEQQDGYKLNPDTLDDFLGRLEGEQHMLVLNNPHNPTGNLYGRGELQKIADVCGANNTLVVADEIYALTTYEFEKFTSMGRVFSEGTFITNGLSKDRSSGGYRLGSCILPEGCPDKLSEAFKKVLATVYTNISTPTQYAAVTAYSPNSEIEKYFEITREIHRMMGSYMSEEFNDIDGIKATIPRGGFYFFTDFNGLADDLKKKGVNTSNKLGESLLSHPHHIATVTGDACMLKPDDYGARIAFVDYDGKRAFDNYRENPPETKSAKTEFVRENAPMMIKGVEALKGYVEYVRR